MTVSLWNIDTDTHRTDVMVVSIRFFDINDDDIDMTRHAHRKIFQKE